MEQNKGKASRIQVETMDKTFPLEVTAEFVLPDYYSEISRLLWVRPTFLPPERFMGGGKAEFSGRVIYEVLYTGPDGALYGTSPEEGYAFSIPLEGFADMEGAQVFAAPVIDAVISRVTGPRKLSVRCRLHARGYGYAEKETEPRFTGIDEQAQLCRLGDTVCAGRVIGEGREEAELSDCIKTAENVRLICARGSVFLPEAVAASDEVRCRGELLLTLLLCREGEEDAVPFTLTQRIPFEKAIPLEGVCPHHHVCATGTVGKIDATVQEGEIAVCAQLALCAMAQCEEETVICRDVFLPGADAECRFTRQAVWQDGGCCNRNFSISAQSPLGDLGFGEDCEILDCVAEAEIAEKCQDGARFSLSGKLQCHLLCHRAGELCAQDAALPFRLFLESGGEKMDVDCRVASCRATISAGKLRADAELQLALRDERHTAVEMLREASFTPRESTPRAAIELYYPAPGERLWDVAKRYGIPPQVLGDANALDADAPAADDSLGGKKFLIIP
ncbi:MAG: hypothetical protein E7624_05780 [Ruminococcaceae bacterium]|nr:hypothetical protein [Oscillospiraceae bacterium]